MTMAQFNDEVAGYQVMVPHATTFELDYQPIYGDKQAVTVVEHFYPLLSSRRRRLANETSTSSNGQSLDVVRSRQNNRSGNAMDDSLFLEFELALQEEQEAHEGDGSVSADIVDSSTVQDETTEKYMMIAKRVRANYQRIKRRRKAARWAGAAFIVSFICMQWGNLTDFLTVFGMAYLANTYKKNFCEKDPRVIGVMGLAVLLNHCLK